MVTFAGFNGLGINGRELLSREDRAEASKYLQFTNFLIYIPNYQNLDLRVPLLGSVFSLC